MKILVLARHPLVQLALASILERNLDHPLIDYFVNESEAVAAARGCIYDGLIINVEGLEAGGFDLIKAAENADPQTKILVYLPDTDYLLTLTYYKAGARIFISYRSKVIEFGEALTSITSSKFFIATDIQEELVENNFFSKSPANYRKLAKTKEFSKREQEVAALLIQGKSTTVISHTLDISRSTVSTHKSHIYKKTGVNNIVDLRKKLFDLYEEKKIISVRKRKNNQ